MKTLSAGMLTRVALCELAQRQPHVLLFDEPTNAVSRRWSPLVAAVGITQNHGVIALKCPERRHCRLACGFRSDASNLPSTTSLAPFSSSLPSPLPN